MLSAEFKNTKEYRYCTYHNQRIAWILPPGWDNGECLQETVLRSLMRRYPYLELCWGAEDWQKTNFLSEFTHQENIFTCVQLPDLSLPIEERWEKQHHFFIDYATHAVVFDNQHPLIAQWVTQYSEEPRPLRRIDVK